MIAGVIGYQHWWTGEMRSNIDFSGIHQDIPILPGITAANRVNLNKELVMSHVNLMWSPVAFVNTGIEYAWGHRVTASSLKGDSHVIQALLRVSF